MILKPNAQSTIEFTFALIVIFFIVYGLIRIFAWAGVDLAERRWAHDTWIINADKTTDEQLNPDFYRAKRLNSVFRGW